VADLEDDQRPEAAMGFVYNDTWEAF